MTAAVRGAAVPGPRLPASGVGWWLLVILAAAATARLTMVSVQLGCALALTVLVVGLYFANRTTGLWAVWLVWLLSPFLRRVFFLSDPIEDSDPLALLPFVVTAIVIAVEYTRVDLDPRSRRLLVLVTAGYAIGVPLGFLFSPAAASFALFAYLTAAGCFVIGYREGEEGRIAVLPRVLMVAAPLLAAYAFRQYFLPLPEWDQVWFETADINSAGSPDGDRIRVWSTLNSPGTFGLILGVAGVCFVAMTRLTPLRLLGAMSVFGALALTYARSAWFGTVVAILAVAFVTRGKAIVRVGAVGLMLAALVPIAFGGATGAALGDRADTFGSLGQDESAQERLATSIRVLPNALALPLGRGVGQAGEATRLSGGGFRFTDNGYLSLMFQVGPFGFLLVMAAVVMAFRSAWRNAWRRPQEVDVLILAIFLFLIVTMFAGDQLYGVGGMIFWYMAGMAMRRGQIERPATA
jgi:hypothetical protein